jgi:hypothetical protein
LRLIDKKNSQVCIGSNADDFRPQWRISSIQGDRGLKRIDAGGSDEITLVILSNHRAIYRAIGV